MRKCFASKQDISATNTALKQDFFEESCSSKATRDIAGLLMIAGSFFLG